MLRLRHALVRCLGICVLLVVFGVFSALVSLPGAHAASVHTTMQQVEVVHQAKAQRLRAATDTCGSVSVYAYNFSGSVEIYLYINYASPSVSYSDTYGNWYGSSSSGSFTGYGSDTEYITFSATTGVSIYGTTYWNLSDGNLCETFWYTFA